MEITFEFFRDRLRDVLVAVGVDESKVLKFINGEGTVDDLEMCNLASVWVDNQMLKLFANWQGIINSDSINTVWEYNKDAIRDDLKEYEEV